uniref:Vascular cell adhesion molecule 1 n=1 Tax=Varanus komodoensis TaxID=61221 RepID=A0A8D2IPK3_VARKO
MARLAPAVSALLLLVSVGTSEEFELEDIVPDHEVAAQIGTKLVLRCRSNGCNSPHFSWRTQLDSPLGGVAYQAGNSSVLTIESVGFQHENNYLCNAACGPEKKEKRVKIDIYSFHRDPIIKISGPLVLGKPAKVTCIVPDVYPSDRLEVVLKTENILNRKEFFEESSVREVQTKNVDTVFTPMEGDIGKQITCTAELPIEEMTFDPKQRLATHLLDIHYGPRNTYITASPGLTLLEENMLTLTCVTDSHPPANIVWKKELANKTVRFLGEGHNYSIPKVQLSDTGTYICEVTNNSTNEVETKPVSISVQGAPRHLSFSIHPATTVQEGESVTLRCSAESNPAARITIRKKTPGQNKLLDSQGGSVHILSVTPDAAGDYECDVKNEFGESKTLRTLRVEYGPRNTTISVTPSNTVKEGETVTMVCSTYGNPTPKVSWKKQLVNGDSQLIQKTATLTIKNARAEDNGRYWCEAVNLFGKHRNAAEITIQVSSPATPALIDHPEGYTEVGFTIKHTTDSSQDQDADIKENTKNYTISLDSISSGTEETKIMIGNFRIVLYLLITYAWMVPVWLHKD